MAQTTITKETWQTTNEVLKNKFKNITKFDTICSATSKRQNEAEEIAKQVDIMIIIGGAKSSNTQKLYDICKKHCDYTYKSKLSVTFRGRYKIKIGISAGLHGLGIQEVIKKMSELNNQEMVDLKERW